MKRTLIGFSAAAALIALVTAATQGGAQTPAPSSEGASVITAPALLAHIKTLASDEYEGRGPGTPGEVKATAYIEAEFKKLGLKPGNPDGSYIQNVPLAGFSSTSEASYSAGGTVTKLQGLRDYMAVSHQMNPEIKVTDSDVVFVGYGIVAPEYGWDDYKGLDVRGKTIVMLVGDPPIPDPADPGKLDDKMFKGRAMTYYGRWTYKYEIASEKGAAAAIIVHETGPAGYPWTVISSSWALEQFGIAARDDKAYRVGAEVWVTTSTATKLCAAGGQDYSALKKAALSKDFKPVPLAAKASFNLKNTVRVVQSKNVVAKLEGSDPQLKNEYVVYSAHWDHLGRNDKALGRDKIYNGAADNASGTAALLEEAKAYAALKTPPKRSILFLATTAEEKGLLGAKYYAENPLYPLSKTVADLNFDGMNLWGITKDLVIVGRGNTTLEEMLGALAGQHGRVILGDPEPEKGGFYRNDEFEFAKQGVPAIHTSAGTDFIGKPAGYGIAKRKEYVAKDYHQVSDEVKPDWDLAGAVADAQLMFDLGMQVSNGTTLPQWNPGTEFKAKRDAMMSQPVR